VLLARIACGVCALGLRCFSLAAVRPGLCHGLCGRAQTVLAGESAWCALASAACVTCALRLCNCAGHRTHACPRLAKCVAAFGFGHPRFPMLPARIACGVCALGLRCFSLAAVRPGLCHGLCGRAQTVLAGESAWCALASAACVTRALRLCNCAGHRTHACPRLAKCVAALGCLCFRTPPSQRFRGLCLELCKRKAADHQPANAKPPTINPQTQSRAANAKPRAKVGCLASARLHSRQGITKHADIGRMPPNSDGEHRPQLEQGTRPPARLHRHTQPVPQTKHQQTKHQQTSHQQTKHQQTSQQTKHQQTKHQQAKHQQTKHQQTAPKERASSPPDSPHERPEPAQTKQPPAVAS